MSKCKHCRKEMDNSWYNITNGYCYKCRMSGFSYIKEKFCRIFFKALNQIIEMI